MTSKTKTEYHLIGGPYNGQTLRLSHGVDTTLTFTARGMTGRYRKGVWCPS